MAKGPMLPLRVYDSGGAVIVPYSYTDTLLKLDNICLSYDGRPILRNVSAEVKDIVIPGRVTGQIVGILGPSGVGKTQLFRIIAGLKYPDSGQVLIADEKGFHPVVTGEVGVVAQSYPLFAHRTVYGNLLLSTSAHEKDSKKAHDIVMEGLTNFSLADKATLYPAQLSGGQRQRVSILQMLLCREDVVLLDEPFSGLDMLSIETACKTISDAANLAEKNTFIVVSHDVTALSAICDHLWCLGRERDGSGNIIPGARIVETYDLLAAGLCYEEGILTDPKFSSYVRSVKERFRTL